MIKTVKHLPKILQDVLELALICETSDIELNRVNKTILAHYNETIVDTSSEFGISMYEKLFNIIPQITDTMELRKFRIRSIFLNKLPYTVRWLYKRLDEIVGAGNYTVELDYNGYSLTIKLSGMQLDMLAEVQKQFRNNIPANMVMLIGNEANISFEVRFLVGLRVGTHYQFNMGSIVLPDVDHS